MMLHSVSAMARSAWIRSAMVRRLPGWAFWVATAAATALGIPQAGPAFAAGLRAPSAFGALAKPAAAPVIRVDYWHWHGRGRGFFTRHDDRRDYRPRRRYRDDRRGYYRRTGPYIGGYIGTPYTGFGFSSGYYYRRDTVPDYRPRRRSRVYYSHARPEPWTADWYDYCRAKYRSFNARTGKYLAYSGRYRMCR